MYPICPRYVLHCIDTKHCSVCWASRAVIDVTQLSVPLKVNDIREPPQMVRMEYDPDNVGHPHDMRIRRLPVLHIEQSILTSSCRHAGRFLQEFHMAQAFREDLRMHRCLSTHRYREGFRRPSLFDVGAR
jgi:hypothetical protein